MADETAETVLAETETKPAKRTVKRTAKKPGLDINKPTPGYEGPTGNRFRMVSEPRTVKENGQIPFIVSAMRKAGKRGFTATEIAEEIKGSIQTVQTPLRVVRYYVSEWRKRGHLVSA
jgi:hypothetical protein